MYLRFHVFLVILYPYFLIGQNDTINQKDEDGRKQGYWIYYGKDRPEIGIPAEGKIEEGTYINDRKEGVWTKYQPDGVTLKLRGEYVNNRPNGTYEKFHTNGALKEKGCFTNGKYSCNTYWYYETGVLSKKTMSGGATDSVILFYPSGCLQQLDVYYKEASPRHLKVSYHQDSCNAVQDSTIYTQHQPADGIPKTPSFESKKHNKSKVQSSIVNTEPTVRYTEENILIYSDSALYNPNGPEHQRRINSASELIFDGTFKDGKAWDGKFYFYDNDGILLRVEIWKEGQFNSLGQL